MLPAASEAFLLSSAKMDITAAVHLGVRLRGFHQVVGVCIIAGRLMAGHLKPGILHQTELGKGLPVHYRRQGFGFL